MEEGNVQCNKIQHAGEHNKTSTTPNLVTPIYHINLEESRSRNQKFLKDLEVAKARLRTYAVYTPTDQELEQTIAEYRKHLESHLRKFSS